VKGCRRVLRPKGGRRFPGREDAAHLASVRSEPCLIVGRRVTVTEWRGVYPKQLVTVEVIHVCGYGRDPHHQTTKARGGHDGESLPLCGLAHREYHDDPKAFEARWGVSLEVERATRWAAYQRARRGDGQ